MDQGQKTEQPTPRRLERAREQGQFPVSKEFVGATVFLCFVWLLTAKAAVVLSMARMMVRDLLAAAVDSDLTVIGLERTLTGTMSKFIVPLLGAGCGLSLLALSAQLATTGLALSTKKLAPDLSRLNSFKRLVQLPGQNLSSAVQALVLLPIFGWVVYAGALSHMAEFVSLPRRSLDQGVILVAQTIGKLLWRAASLLFVLGLIDLVRQRRKWGNQIRMTKQEVREEHKDSEGNPMIKNRIRRLQREAARHKMLQQVPKSTAVVVNPTHYAVALRYDMAEGGAPKVLAKGQNWVALKIRELAVRNQIPIIENPPLARALYASAEVGQEIPAHLYQAVAEVLAYIYRLMKGR